MNYTQSITFQKHGSKLLFFICSFILAGAYPTHAKVQITSIPGGGWGVKTSTYQATLDDVGGLTSLTVNGAEFLQAGTEMSWAGRPRTTIHGIFASPHRQWFDPKIVVGPARIEGHTVSTEGNGWQLSYTFEDDAIVLSFGGKPEGVMRSLDVGYPNSNLCVSLAPDLHRAVDPIQQGDIGFPPTGNPEPGDYTVIAANGAGLEFTDAFWLTHTQPAQAIITPPHRADMLMFGSSGPPKSSPQVRRINVLSKVDLARSLSMQIISPNPDHLFVDDGPIVFPINLKTHYGQAFEGSLRFEGHNYIFKDRRIESAVPIQIAPSSTVALDFVIEPEQPGHYIGNFILSDGEMDLYIKRVGFVYKPQDIPPVQPPADFDAFWDDTMARLEDIPLELTLTEQPQLENERGKVYLARFRSWDNLWAWAWLYEPKHADQVDAAVECPPVSKFQPGPARPPSGELYIAAAVHGGDLTNHPPDVPFDYMNGNLDEREQARLRYAYATLARCYDIMKQHPLCNGNVHARGGSQGGGLSFVLAGLRPVTSVTGTTLALMRTDWSVKGLIEWGPHAPQGSDVEQVAEVARYYDPACFMHRVQAPVKLYMGLFDFTGPVEAVFTGINDLPQDTPCRVVLDPYGGHFTANYTGRDAEDALEIPRWQGSAEDNMLNR